jgi:murein DD-endopeptidase MepM/ murein hydrolase activator NlpD
MTRIAVPVLACAIAIAPPPRPSPAISAEARSIRPGELVVLTIAVPSAVGGVKVEAFGHPAAAYRADDLHWQSLVGIDLNQPPGSYHVVVTVDGGSRGSYDLHVTPRSFPTRRLTVDEAFVNPPPETTERIAREARELEAIYHAPATERSWDGTFVRPVPGPANSQFGTRSIFNGVPRNPHSGGDFLSPAGTPVLAPNSGRVVLARDLYFSGNTVIVDHGAGLLSLLAHLSAIEVREGDGVGRGQEIGKVGATGRVTGPHLHWAVRANGGRVDPLSLLAVLGKSEADIRRER